MWNHSFGIYEQKISNLKILKSNQNEAKEGYINYLKNNIVVPNESKFYDTKSKKFLLSLKLDALPFEISGTTDVVIARKSCFECHALSCEIQVGFELKKEVQDVHTPQAIGQLF